jgi:5-oxoprolinase (ATP-hydrolysing)
MPGDRASLSLFARSTIDCTQFIHRRHLPDITIITPVFSRDPPHEIIFFTASRGHHADIGGLLPGSMPPTSVTIFDEGANIESFKIVCGGVFDREGLWERMVEQPAKWEGSSGCRNFKDVESDLKAVGIIHHSPPFFSFLY